MKKLAIVYHSAHGHTEHIATHARMFGQHFARTVGRVTGATS